MQIDRFPILSCGISGIGPNEFLVTSVEFTVFEKNYESLLECYLAELQNNLKKVNPALANTYGLFDLVADFEKYKLYTLYPLVGIVPSFWAGQRNYDSTIEWNNIDMVLKSEYYISHFENWVTFLFSIR